jgi:creatinine amidohydrolase
MFPDELEAAFAACPAAWFAYGLCEPHGPHCVLGLDLLKAHGLAVQAARAHGGIVAPPDSWHVHEIGRYAIWGEKQIGNARPWLTAVPPWVHFKNVCYHVRAAEVLGFHAAILLTGHYGPNWRDLKTLVEKLQPWVRMRLCGLPDFEANRPGFDGADGDHAGKVETSLLWALEPDGVDMSRLPEDATPPQFARGADAALSDRRVGERMVDDIVAWLGAKQRELLAAYDPGRPSRLRTFDDVETFWEEEIRPVLPDFASLKGSWTEADAPAEGSRWRAGWIPKRY